MGWLSRLLRRKAQSDETLTASSTQDLKAAAASAAVHDLMEQTTVVSAPRVSSDSAVTGMTVASAQPPSPGQRRISTPARPAEWKLGQVILDEFLIQRKLGQGGFGAVYLARSKASSTAFAVKRALVASAEERRGLLSELQTWIDLPAHPHLTACRFFRTVGDEVLIFAEYVDGGSLNEWIQKGYLYAGDQQAALLRVIDIAIQFAWGLEAIHQLGLTHQDVKPGNVVLTATGIAKVTDFGLSVARSRTARRHARPAEASLLFSASGGTPAYMSPEQSQSLQQIVDGTPSQARVRLSRQSDIYSWGVSVLEMFIGRRLWLAGPLAGAALEKYLSESVADARLPSMPAKVAEVLRHALQEEPSARWRDLAEAAEELARTYEQLAGKPYPRAVPAALTRAAPVAASRRTATHISWQDPRTWLAKARQLAGGRSRGDERVAPSAAAGFQAQAIGDLLAFEEALTLYERAVAAGRTDLAGELRQLRVDKALAHEYAHDLPGALALWDQNIVELERLSVSAPCLENAVELAENCVNKGNTLAAGGQFQPAIEHYDRATRAVEPHFAASRDAALGKLLATAFNNRGHALACLGRHEAALPFYDRAITLREELYRTRENADQAEDLAHSCMNKANSLVELNRQREALGLYDRAVELHERAVERDGRSEFRPELAKTWANRAGALVTLGEASAALESSRRAVALWETLVEEEGHREWTADFALGYLNTGAALYKLDNNCEAAQATERALDLFDRLFRQEGQHHLAFRVAQSHSNLGDIRMALAAPEQALAHYEQAAVIFGDTALRTAAGGTNRGLSARGMVHVSVRKLQLLFDARRMGDALAYYEAVAPAMQQLIREEGLLDLLPDLALAQLNAAGLLSMAGRGQEAVRLCNEAVACYEQALTTMPGGELVPDLLRARVLRALLLSEAGEVSRARAEAKATVTLMRREAERRPGEQPQIDLQWALKTLSPLL